MASVSMTNKEHPYNVAEMETATDLQTVYGMSSNSGFAYSRV
jgi:hypothetical protein